MSKLSAHSLSSILFLLDVLYSAIRFIHEDFEMINSPHCCHRSTKRKLKPTHRAVPYHDVWEKGLESDCHSALVAKRDRCTATCDERNASFK